MYSIGRFSKESEPTVRTLRYYDEKDLLKPSHVREGGHSYYEEQDLLKLHAIKISLNQSIGSFVEEAIGYYMLVDLLSSSAVQMLWNSVFLGFAYTVVYLVSMITRKPHALYFAVDFAYLQGFPRENSKHLYSIKENKKCFQLITTIFVLKRLVMNLIMAILIIRHDVEAFMHLILLRKALGLIFWILILLDTYFHQKGYWLYTNTWFWPVD